MSEKYCDIQESCKLLQQANAQYNKVVKQNKELQKASQIYKGFLEDIANGRIGNCRCCEEYAIRALKGEIND